MHELVDVHAEVDTRAYHMVYAAACKDNSVPRPDHASVTEDPDQDRGGEADRRAAAYGPVNDDERGLLADASGEWEHTALI
jgi:deferrochelatase/peroxidase EfeB